MGSSGPPDGPASAPNYRSGCGALAVARGRSGRVGLTSGGAPPGPGSVRRNGVGRLAASPFASEGACSGGGATERSSTGAGWAAGDAGWAVGGAGLAAEDEGWAAEGGVWAAEDAGWAAADAEGLADGVGCAAGDAGWVAEDDVWPGDAG